ncbi:MAG: Smr/MutS family protein [Saprospiraceae bacterium]|nr:Smr/MutS family protein [Saprospiraceae bacterium]MCB0545604.1 Smr/MutS family protein [Saprospiraceae bacterium]
MLFAIGTKVQFRYTGESGVVTALLDEGMLQVRLDNDPDMEIPAFEEDLISEGEAGLTAAKPKSVPNNKPSPPPKRELKASYHILKPKGLQLAFEPMPGRDGTVSQYNGWLINDTPLEFLFELDLYTGTRDIFTADGKLPAVSAQELGILRSDDLNDLPEVFFSVQRVSTEGAELLRESVIRIRPKQFFNNLQTVPVVNFPAYRFLLLGFDEISGQATPAKEDLAEYTRQNIRTPRHRATGNSVPFMAFNVEEFASFEPEIDLHIEKLIRGFARLDKGEILRIQMFHFQGFLDKAIRLGVPRVFVIHGVGEGKLRETIAARLREHPQVARFKNEFHHKYGYGATEVIFR